MRPFICPAGRRVRFCDVPLDMTLAWRPGRRHRHDITTAERGDTPSVDPSSTSQAATNNRRGLVSFRHCEDAPRHQCDIPFFQPSDGNGPRDPPHQRRGRWLCGLGPPGTSDHRESKGLGTDLPGAKFHCCYDRTVPPRPDTRGSSHPSCAPVSKLSKFSLANA